MDSESRKVDHSFFGRWIVASILGWLLGFVLVIAMAMTWGLIAGEAQFMVGIGMGAGVGYLQGRLAGEWNGSAREWLWASVIGMGIPFVLWDVGHVMGAGSFLSLQLCVVIGGLLAGLLQRRLLGAFAGRANWWVAASIAGWGGPAGLMALGDGFRGMWGGIASMSGMFLGGALLGTVTGAALVWMRR